MYDYTTLNMYYYTLRIHECHLRRVAQDFVKNDVYEMRITLSPEYAAHFHDIYVKKKAFKFF